MLVEHQRERLQALHDLVHVLEHAGHGLVLVHHAVEPDLAFPLMTEDTRACGPLEARLVYTLPQPARRRATQGQRWQPRSQIAAAAPREVMSANEAVLYRTHILNPMICREIERLRSEVADRDHFVVGYLKRNRAGLRPSDKTHRMYRRGDLADLPYPNKTIFVDWAKPIGDNDLPVLAFYREQPSYEFYWIVEYDVRYTGNWGALFAELGSSDTDYLSTTIQDYDENPRWVWWHTLVNAPTGPLPNGFAASRRSAGCPTARSLRSTSGIARVARVTTS